MDDKNIGILQFKFKTENELTLFREITTYIIGKLIDENVMNSTNFIDFEPILIRLHIFFLFFGNEYNPPKT